MQLVDHRPLMSKIESWSLCLRKLSWIRRGNDLALKQVERLIATSPATDLQPMLPGDREPERLAYCWTIEVLFSIGIAVATQRASSMAAEPSP